MWWLKNLYLGKSVRGKEREIRRKLWRHAGMVNVQILAISLQPGEQIDVIPSAVLMQRAFPKDELKVIGLAGGWEEAMELIRLICQETFDATGDGDMRSFLCKKDYKKSRSF